MRTIHTNLITAQQSGADPYIYLSINSTNYSSRLLRLEHIEEPYRNSAIIILANYDHHFDLPANNLHGKSFTIGYGYVTAGSVNRYCGDGAGSEAMPTLWVKSQSMVSAEGELVCVLECEGSWMRLREYSYIAEAEAVPEPYFDITFQATNTVYQIIEKVLVEAGFTLSAESIDNIIQAFYPIFAANPSSFDDPAGIIYRLIQMTKCYIREVESSNFEVVYPQTTDAAQETYYSYQAPYFKRYTEKLSLLVPNSIVVFCNKNIETGQWDTDTLIEGTAKDQPSIDAYGEVTKYYIAPFISTPEDADNRADAILTRLKNEILAGELILSFHDCRVELYDKIQVEDRRGH